MGFAERGYLTSSTSAHQAVTQASELAAEELSQDSLCLFVAGPLTDSNRASEHRKAGQATGEILIEAIRRELPEGVELDWDHVMSNVHEVAAERGELERAA
jgi:hypothetical protein